MTKTEAHFARAPVWHPFYRVMEIESTAALLWSNSSWTEQQRHISNEDYDLIRFVRFTTRVARAAK